MGDGVGQPSTNPLHALRSLINVPVAALALYILFAFLAFGWRTIIQYRRTGDTGLRLHAEPNTAQWWSKLGFIVALLIGFAAPIFAIVGLENISALDKRWLHIAGVVVATSGVLLTLVAQLSMGDSWRIGVDPTERTTLVTEGAFTIARNPVFTAMLVTAAGLSMMIPNLVSITGLLALLLALEVQVRLVEEPFLLSLHGENYRAYADRVGRFLPGLGRRRRRPTS